MIKLECPKGTRTEIQNLDGKWGEKDLKRNRDNKGKFFGKNATEGHKYLAWKIHIYPWQTVPATE